MFRVLIVDDEPIIRKGLINVIDWNSIDCFVCGEAKDGIEGIQKIKTLKPDIIIADIRMPEMDGLKMISETKNLIPYSKIIILTGFRDYEYMHEAIKLGAFDYILKPSKIHDISSVLRRAVVALRYDMEKQQEFERLRENFTKSIPVLKEKLLYNIMFNIEENNNDVISELNLYNFKLEKFIICLIEIDKLKNQELAVYDTRVNQIGIVKTFEEIFKEKFIVDVVTLSSNKFVFIVQANLDKNDFSDNVCKSAKDIQKLIRNYFNCSLTIAVSNEGEGVSELSEKLNECLEAIEYKYCFGDNSIILYKDLATFDKGKSFSIYEDCHTSLVRAVKAGNMDGTLEALRRIKEATSNMALDVNALKDFYATILISLCNIKIPDQCDSNEDSKLHIEKIYEIVESQLSFDSLHSTLETISMDMVSKILSNNKKNMSLVLKRAIDYLDEHYNENINLNMVSSYVYVSSYYLSRMFKRELNINFIDYLNTVRINKAMEYMKNPGLKDYEICEKVGIQDSHYFSKLFKKYAGMTPTEYRQQDIKGR